MHIYIYMYKYLAMNPQGKFSSCQQRQAVRKPDADQSIQKGSLEAKPIVSALGWGKNSGQCHTKKLDTATYETLGETPELGNW